MGVLLDEEGRLELMLELMKRGDATEADWSARYRGKKRDPSLKSDAQKKLHSALNKIHIYISYINCS